MNKLRKAVAIATAVAMSAGTFAFATPAFAAMNSSSITITTINRGSIDNDTSARSYTGKNTALGSVGGRGGDGGDVENGSGDFNNGGAGTGDGGNGGNGGAGGLVDTGDASADAGSENALNSTDVDVQVPVDMNSASVLIDTNNDRIAPTQNHIDNDTEARSRTGRNTAEGSVAGNADDAGEVEVDGDGDNNNGGATTGDGGNGGAGGLGGTVLTGRADSFSTAVNVLNTIFVRVRN